MRGTCEAVVQSVQIARTTPPQRTKPRLLSKLRPRLQIDRTLPGIPALASEATWQATLVLHDGGLGHASASIHAAF
jgi:hypothetical protein